MKIQPSYSTTATCIKTTSIYRLVSRLQVGMLSLATNKKSIIINDADKALFIFADENILTFVIGSLLSNAVNCSSDFCIRIETFLEKNTICIQIHNNGVFIYNNLVHNLSHIAEAVRKLNGSICIQSGKDKTVTVALSLPFIQVE